MALHHQTHPQYVEGCFACKAAGLNFGMVPGGYRDATSTSNFDRDAFLDQFGDSDGSVFGEQRVRDAQSDVRKKLKEFQDA